MRFICALVLTIELSILAFLNYKKNGDILNPMSFYAVLTFMRYVPGILILETHMGITIDLNLIYKVTLFQAIAIISTAFGYGFSGVIKGKYKSYSVTYSKSMSMKKCGLYLYVIGGIFAILFLKRIGGVKTVLSGIKGINAGNGNSYIRAGIFLMVVGMCMILKGRNEEGEKSFGFYFLILFLGYAFVFAIQTSRSPVLEAAMIVAIVYHYSVKKIKLRQLFSLKYLFIITVCIAFLLILPSFRSSTGFKDLSIEESSIDMKTIVEGLIEELSFVSRDGFIYEYANFENYWFGANIINLLCAPIPSTLIKWKPPVDDGLYLANLVVGYDVRPPERVLPWYNSYPMSTPGGCYINFGILGLIFGSFLIGFLYNRIYKRIKKTNYDVVNVIMYQLIIYQLELTCLSIVQTLTPAVFTLFFAKVVCGRKVIKERLNKNVY